MWEVQHENSDFLLSIKDMTSAYFNFFSQNSNQQEKIDLQKENRNP